MPFIKTGRGQSLGVVEPPTTDKPTLPKQSATNDPGEGVIDTRDDEAK
jgi:hypothetical protein